MTDLQKKKRFEELCKEASSIREIVRKQRLSNLKLEPGQLARVATIPTGTVTFERLCAERRLEALRRKRAAFNNLKGELYVAHDIQLTY